MCGIKAIGIAKELSAAMASLDAAMREAGIAALEQRCDELKKALKSALKPGETAVVDGIQATVYESMRENIDKAAIIAAGIDISPFIKHSTTTTLKITKK